MHMLPLHASCRCNQSDTKETKEEHVNQPPCAHATLASQENCPDNGPVGPARRQPGSTSEPEKQRAWAPVRLCAWPALHRHTSATDRDETDPETREWDMLRRKDDEHDAYRVLHIRTFIPAVVGSSSTWRKGGVIHPMSYDS